MSETTDPESLVPDGFDLEEARNAPSTTSPGDRTACPHCGSTQTSRNTRKARGRTPLGEFSCDVCRRGFDEDDLQEANDE